MRDLKLAADPLCEVCRSKGLLVQATEVHHEVEVRRDESLALDMSNLVSLCGPCHSTITAKRQGAPE